MLAIRLDQMLNDSSSGLGVALVDRVWKMALLEITASAFFQYHFAFVLLETVLPAGIV